MRNTNRPFDERHAIESLEARSLFSGYFYNSPSDYLDLPALLRSHEPSIENMSAAVSVAGLGDINADGYDDYAIGRTSITASGVVAIFSGQDGSIIRTLSEGADGAFGYSLANIGDINNDGVPELLVGSPSYDGTDDNLFNPTGRAYVFSGIDGAIVHTFEGTTVFGGFGLTLSRLNDATNDDITDVIVGAPGYRPILVNPEDPPLPPIMGEVFLFSGADGSLVRSHTSGQAGDGFGSALAASSNDGNDQQYFAVGAPLHDVDTNTDAGRVFVFRLDGAMAHFLSGAQSGDQFGSALAVAVGPVSSSITAAKRLIIGVPGADFGTSDTGTSIPDRGRIETYVLSDGTHRVAAAAANPTPGALMGSRIAVIGDLNYNGYNDILVSAIGSGDVYAFRADGAAFDSADHFNTANPASHRLGAVAQDFVGDVNDDGIFDIISSDGSSVTIVSSLGVGSPLVINGASDNFRYLWSYVSQIPVLFVDGAARAFDHVPGLVQAPPGPNGVRSRIDGIGNDGTIYFHNETIQGFRSEIMVLRNDVAVTLQSLVTSVIGDAPIDYDNFEVERVGSGGHLLLSEPIDESFGPRRTYVFHDGALTSLWTGLVYDVNQSGTVVGTATPEGGARESRIWTAETGPLALPELSGSLGINDAGLIVGARAGTITPVSPGILASFLNGTVTDLGIAQDSASNGNPSWRILDVGDDGRVLVLLVLPSVRAPDSYVNYIYEPDTDGLRRLHDAAHAVPSDVEITSASSVNVLLPDGGVLLSNAVLTAISESDIGTLRPGSPVSSITVEGVRYTVGVNQYNELVSFTEDVESGTWRVRRMTSDHVATGVDQIQITADASGFPYVIIADGRTVKVHSARGPGYSEYGAVIAGVNNLPAIVRGMTVFTNSVGVVHIAGFTAAGDLVIYFRNGSISAHGPSGWTFDNISQTHLGGQTPDIVSNLAAYVTPWHGMNLAGRDRNGDVHAVWWAPGLTYWRTDNISTAAAQGDPRTEPAFVGELSAFVSPWGTMHINGLNLFGQVMTLWWAPGSGWTRTNILDSGPLLTHDSLTSYVTPWGGLNVLGRNELGNPVVYWWSPESNLWTAEILPSRDSPVSLAGELAALVETSDVVSQNIYGRAEDGSLFRLFWTPDGNPWTVENITDSLDA